MSESKTSLYISLKEIESTDGEEVMQAEMEAKGDYVLIMQGIAWFMKKNPALGAILYPVVMQEITGQCFQGTDKFFSKPENQNQTNTDERRESNEEKKESGTADVSGPSESVGAVRQSPDSVLEDPTEDSRVKGVYTSKPFDGTRQNGDLVVPGTEASNAG